MMQKHGRIMKGVGGFYTVEAADGTYICKARGIFRKAGITPLPGDQVVITIGTQEECTIDEILPRRNFLTRPTVANIDYFWVVSATCEPNPSTLLIDKMTTLAAYRGIQAHLVITKSDLGDSSPLAEIYQRAGIPTFTVGQGSDDGIEEIANRLREHINVFAGNSGVGKSTLLNRLDPALQLETAAISNKLGRGRHTTRHVELFPVCGGFVADTPGFSSFSTVGNQVTILKEDLADCFVDFQPYLGQCRFTTCSHIADQGCAILDAVQNGKIHPSRHASYATMYKEVKDISAWQTRKR